MATEDEVDLGDSGSQFSILFIAHVSEGHDKVALLLFLEHAADLFGILIDLQILEVIFIFFGQYIDPVLPRHPKKTDLSVLDVFHQEGDAVS